MRGKKYNSLIKELQISYVDNLFGVLSLPEMGINSTTRLECGLLPEGRVGSVSVERGRTQKHDPGYQGQHLQRWVTVTTCTLWYYGMERLPL